MKRGLQRSPQLGCNGGGVGDAAYLGQQDRELVSGQAGDGVHVAHHAGQARPDLGQHLVAVVVAEGVIDLLEPV